MDGNDWEGFSVQLHRQSKSTTTAVAGKLADKHMRPNRTHVENMCSSERDLG